MKKCPKLFIIALSLCLALLFIPPANFDNQIDITSISYEENDN